MTRRVFCQTGDVVSPVALASVVSAVASSATAEVVSSRGEAR